MDTMNIARVSLWKVTGALNAGCDVTTRYFRSRAEAEELHQRWEISDGVKYAGSFLEAKALYLLDDGNPWS